MGMLSFLQLLLLIGQTVLGFSERCSNNDPTRPEFFDCSYGCCDGECCGNIIFLFFYYISYTWPILVVVLLIFACFGLHFLTYKDAERAYVGGNRNIFVWNWKKLDTVNRFPPRKLTY